MRDPGYTYSDGFDMYGICQTCNTEHKHRYWCNYANVDSSRKDWNDGVKVYQVTKEGALIIKGDNTTVVEPNEVTPELEDQYTVRKALDPLWVFLDINHEKGWAKYPYWCFIGMHYPEGLVREDEKAYKAAYNSILDGTYVLEQKKARKPDWKMGWGNGRNPGEAFRLALRMAGYINTEKK